MLPEREVVVLHIDYRLDVREDAATQLTAPIFPCKQAGCNCTEQYLTKLFALRRKKTLLSSPNGTKRVSSHFLGKSELSWKNRTLSNAAQKGSAFSYSTSIIS